MKRNWKKLRVGDWGEVSGGRQLSPHYITGTPRPYLRVANVLDDHIDTSDVLSMLFTDAEFARFKLEIGDILLNEGQSIELVGRSALYKGLPTDCAFQNTLVRFRAGPDCDANFAHALFKQMFNDGVLRSIAKRTTSIAHLGVNRFAGLKVDVPSLPEQRAIAKYSGLFEKAIGEFSQLIAAKREYRRGLAQQLLTGKKRFPKFKSSTGRQTGEFGSIPNDWKVSQISKIAFDISIRGATDGAIVYSCTKYNGLVPSLEYFGKQVFSRNLDAYKRLAAGDFAYATNHIEEGSIGLLREGQRPGLVSPMYTVFRCNAEVNPEFLFSVLKTESYRRVFEKRTSASVDRRGSLRWKEFSKIRVPLPSRKEQDRIVNVLALLDSEISLLEKEREQFGLYKQGLLSRLLSGEIPVAA